MFYPDFIYIYLTWPLKHLPTTLTSDLPSLVQLKKSYLMINDYWSNISYQENILGTERL